MGEINTQVPATLRTWIMLIVVSTMDVVTASAAVKKNTAVESFYFNSTSTVNGPERACFTYPGMIDRSLF